MKGLYKEMIILGILLALVFAPLISAMTWDNIKDVKGNKVTIIDNLGLGGKLVEVDLLDNTDYCLSECYAIWNVTIYKDDDNFLDEIEFLNVLKNGQTLDYKFEYSFKNKWETFDVKRKVPAGNYLIKLTGYKKMYDDIDWQPTFYGKKITEWAWWHTSAPISPCPGSLGYG